MKTHLQRYRAISLLTAVTILSLVPLTASHASEDSIDQDVQIVLQRLRESSDPNFEISLLATTCAKEKGFEYTAAVFSKVAEALTTESPWLSGIAQGHTINSLIEQGKVEEAIKEKHKLEQKLKKAIAKAQQTTHGPIEEPWKESTEVDGLPLLFYQQFLNGANSSIATAYEREENWAKAEKIYREVAKTSDEQDKLEANLQIATCLWKQGKYQEALWYIDNEVLAPYNAGDETLKFWQRKTAERAEALKAEILAYLSGEGMRRKTVYVLQDGSSECTNRIKPMLEAAGYEVTCGVNEYDYHGGLIDDYGAVLLLDGNSYWQGMPSDGQQAIYNYVNNGGGLILFEWVAYEVRYYGGYDDRWVLLDRSSGMISRNETYTKVGTHQITEGLPDSWVHNDCGSNIGSKDQGMVIVRGSQAGDAVVVDTLGNGRIIEFAIAPGYGGYNCWDSNTAQLLINAVKWATRGVEIVPSTIDIVPDTLNLSSSGKWITCYIELPTGYDVANVDPGAVKISQVNGIPLSSPILSSAEPSTIGDYDNDGVPDLMVKFNRQAVQNLFIPAETAKLTVSGLGAEFIFEGSDDVKAVRR